jgi:hypothetical protein
MNHSDKLNYLDDSSFKIVIDFLEVQEYMKTLTISKNIQNKSNKYKKIRYPCLFVLGYRHRSFGISPECRTMMKIISENIKVQYDDKDDDVYDKRYCKLLLLTILKMGSKKVCSMWSHLEIQALPWMFRNCVKFDDHYGEGIVNINYEKYIHQLIEKYNNKLNTFIDQNEKRNTESLFFRKIAQKRNFCEIYDVRNDKYMDLFNIRLKGIIDK